MANNYGYGQPPQQANAPQMAMGPGGYGVGQPMAYGGVQRPPQLLSAPFSGLSPAQLQHQQQQQQQQLFHQQQQQLQAQQLMKQERAAHSPAMSPQQFHLQQQQQQHQLSQTAEPQRAVVDPVAAVRALVTGSLRQAFTVLMQAATEMVRAQRQQADADAAPSSVGSGGVGTPGTPSDRKPVTAAGGVERFQTALDRFYAVCDQVEEQFMLILECSRRSRYVDKFMPPLEGAPPQPGAAVPPVADHVFADVAQQHVMEAVNVQRIIGEFVAKLADDDGDAEDGAPVAKAARRQTAGAESTSPDDAPQLADVKSEPESPAAAATPAPLYANRESVEIVDDAAS